MAYSSFMSIVRRKFPHEIIRFEEDGGRWFAHMKGGVRLSSNSNCKTILVEGKKQSNGVYGFHAIWKPVQFA